VPRLSPLEASAKYLKHLADAWNNVPNRKLDDRFEDQPVVLTVPASFDDTARTLTAEAAKQAGLKHVTLLEEPQAAFYAWLGTHTPKEAGKLKPGMRCLVIDVGGGTSDFSLIRAGEEQGELTFIRDAVGDHLLLGGDNMDLALAKAVEAKMPGGRLDAPQFGTLVQACRAAKETLLGEDPPDHVPVTVVGRGRSVVGGTVSVNVTVADVTVSLFDGFFPFVAYDAEPARAARAGLQEMGLPYVADPGVTRHLAAFLRQHLPAGETVDAILFNGGVFTPNLLRERVIEVLRPWFEAPGKPWKPLVLTSPSLDLAVAWGAAYFGWLKQSGGRRIGGGIPRSYYLGVSDSAESKAEVSVVCVVPRNLQEGEEIAIAKPELELQIGEPVLFPLYTSTVRGDDAPGEVLSLSPTQLLQLPPLHTVLRGGKRSGVKRILVTLAAKCTEIGTLELFCVSREGNRWRLEFNVRDAGRLSAGPDETDTTADRATVLDVFQEDKVQAAASRIRSCYGSNSPTPPELPKALESALEAGRLDWPTGLCRRMWDSLTEVAEQRTKSPAHLARWYNLAGFCLRPGFGDLLDRYRVEAVWKVVNAVTTVGTTKVLTGPEGGADYWIMWRRVAGGLNTAVQQTLFGKLKPLLLPSKSKILLKPGSNELAEMWRAVASFERLDARTKQSLGEVLLAQIGKSPVPTYAFWSLTRLGARRQLYGPLNTLIHPDVAEQWIGNLLDFVPTSDTERLGWGFSLAQLARRTGLRGVDIGDDHRHSVGKLLRALGVPEAWPRMVEDVVEPEGEDDSRLFGEGLPIGLRLPRG